VARLESSVHDLALRFSTAGRSERGSVGHQLRRGRCTAPVHRLKQRVQPATRNKGVETHASSSASSTPSAPELPLATPPQPTGHRHAHADRGHQPLRKNRQQSTTPRRRPTLRGEGCWTSSTLPHLAVGIYSRVSMAIGRPAGSSPLYRFRPISLCVIMAMAMAPGWGGRVAATPPTRSPRWGRS